jgi:hypothetical protein
VRRAAATPARLRALHVRPFAASRSSGRTHREVGATMTIRLSPATENKQMCDEVTALDHEVEIG